MLEIILTVPDENAMLKVGAKLASVCGNSAVIFLHGQLGAGKTTFARGFLQGLGYQGKVKSPTYTLVEPYDIDGQQLFHFDLYRLKNPVELEDMGIQDYFSGQSICMIEWPELGADYLPPCDLACNIEPHKQGRKLQLTSNTELGKMILLKFENV